MQNIWQQLSKEISQTVAATGRSIAAVDGRSGHTSSGILWKSDLVLTVAHAIRHESEVRVVFEQGRTVRARLAGRAPSVDIALLKLDGTIDGTLAEFGATADLQVGEFVLAVGRTRRGNIVASSGILSGVMGEWHTGRARVDQFIRPDLMLYSGFSGGALVRGDGKILGMTTSALLRGKPLTIPASTLVHVAEELAAKGRVPSPYIGLVMQPVTIPEAIQKQSSVSARAGLLVMHVEPGGPAESGGALLGDILVGLDTQTFDSIEDLQDVLGRRSIGDEVTVIVIRGGQKVELKIKIGERPVR